MASPAAVLQILVTANTAQATTALTKTDAQLKKTTTSANAASTSLASRLAPAAKMAGAAAGVALVYGLGKAVSVGAEFEKQMDAVGAVSNASGKEMKKLEKQALSLGQKTKFSAMEVAEAQEELVKGGLKVKDVIGGALPAALSLAAAGELELADASSTTVNAMKLFGLQAKDASSIADMLATAANKTTGDVEDFSVALKQGGAVAKLAGLNMNQTVVALEALAESGVKNSDAGTSMKTAFIQLLKPTEKQAALADQLNLSFVNQAGNMKNMATLSADLIKATDGMTNAQRAATFATLAGTDGVRTLNALYAAGPEALKKYADANRENGTANEIAKEKMDNLSGSMEQLGGAVQTLAIKFSGFVNPAIRSAVDWLSGALTDISKINLNKLMRDEDVRGVVDAFADIGRAVKTWWEEITWPILQKAAPYIKQYFGGLARVIGGFVEVIGGILSLDFKQALNGMKQIVRGAFDEVIGILGIVTAPIRHAFAKIGEIAAGAFDGTVDAVLGSIRFVFDKVMGALSSTLRVAATIADKLSGVPIIGDKFDGLAEAATGAADEIDGFRESLRKDKEQKTYSSGLDKLKDKYRNLSDQAEETSKRGGKAFDDLAENAKRNGQKTSDKLGRMATNVINSYGNMSDGASDGLQTLGENTNEALKSMGVKEAIQFSIKLAKKATNKVEKLQTGGVIVPGQGDGDKVPALLEPGEVVLNKKAVAAMGGAAKANSINSKIPRFAKGGVAGGLDFALGPYTVPPIQYAADHADGNSHVHITGTTTPWVVAIGKQLQRMGMLVGEHPAFGGVAPPPSHSLTGGHYDALAIDVNDPSGNEPKSWVASIARILGGSGIAGAVAEKIARVILKGPDGPLKSIGQSALDKARNAANKYIASKAPSGIDSSYSSIEAGGSVVAQMGKILLGNNFSRAGAAGIIGNAYRESLWDPGSVGTGGGGLFGFTTSPVSLADLQNFASHKGTSWKNVGTQMEFMLANPAGGGLMSDDYYNGLEGFLKSTNNVHEATYRFMNEWERPGIPAFEDRLAGAQKAFSMNSWQEGGIISAFARYAEGTGDKGASKKDLHGSISGGKHDAAWKRFSKARRIAKHLKEMLGDRGRVARIDETISMTETLSGLSSSPGGSELSPDELAKQIRLNQHLLEVLVRARKLANSGMGLLNFPKGMSTTGVGKTQVKNLKTTFGSYLTDLTGVTGKGGRIFDTKVHLDELRHTGLGAGATGIDISGLRSVIEAAQYGAFAGLPKFHQGGTVPGPANREVPIMARGGEVVSPKGGVNVTNNFSFDEFGMLVETYVDDRLAKRERIGRDRSRQYA